MAQNDNSTDIQNSKTQPAHRQNKNAVLSSSSSSSSSNGSTQRQQQQQSAAATPGVAAGNSNSSNINTTNRSSSSKARRKRASIPRSKANLLVLRQYVLRTEERAQCLRSHVQLRVDVARFRHYTLEPGGEVVLQTQKKKKREKNKRRAGWR